MLRWVLECFLLLLLLIMVELDLIFSSRVLGLSAFIYDFTLVIRASKVDGGLVKRELANAEWRTPL